MKKTKKKLIMEPLMAHRLDMNVVNVNNGIEIF